jgi:phosphoribosylglycinamide formyltransferase-1
VHWVDDVYDNGKHVVQRRCPVLPGDSAEALAARVFQEECLAYPEALRQVLGGG